MQPARQRVNWNGERLCANGIRLIVLVTLYLLGAELAAWFIKSPDRVVGSGRHPAAFTLPPSFMASAAVALHRDRRCAAAVGASH